MIEHALIFAAGRGERLYPYTKTCPKPLLEVQGLPVLFWHIEKLKALNIKTIFINHAYLGGAIKARVCQAYPNLNIQFLAEPPGGLETGGTLAFFKDKLIRNTQALLCINADIYCDYEYDLNPTFDDNLKAKLILVPTENTELKGNFNINEYGFVDTHGNPNFIFSGIAYYHHQALQELPIGRYSIRDFLFKWSSQKQIKADIHPGAWLDIGSVDAWLKIRQALPVVDY